MVTRQTIVQLTDPLVDLLDKRAAREHVSRSHLIREAVEAYLREDREAEIDRQIIESYTRFPPGGEHDIDEWGDLNAWHEGLAAARDPEHRGTEDDAW